MGTIACCTHLPHAGPLPLSSHLHTHDASGGGTLFLFHIWKQIQKILWGPTANKKMELVYKPSVAHAWQCQGTPDETVLVCRQGGAQGSSGCGGVMARTVILWSEGWCFCPGSTLTPLHNDAAEG